MSRATRLKRLSLVAKIVISAGLVAGLIATTDTSELRDAFQRVGVGPLVLGVAALAVLVVVQSVRWLVVARALDLDFPFPAATAIVFIGTFFNQVLPSSIGGDAARVWRLTRAGVSVPAALNSVLFDRLVALVTVVLITGVGTPLLFSWIEEPGKRIALVAAELAILATVAVVLLLDRLPLPRFIVQGRGIRAGFSRDARRLFLSPWKLAWAVGLSLLIHSGVSAIVWMLAREVGADIELAECLILVPAVMLLAVLPISVAGWGVREGAMVVAMGLLGVAREDALATSVLFGFATAGSALPGLLLWLRSDRKHAPANLSESGGTATIDE
jgi:glycosyltransferase 2 family protein